MHSDKKSLALISPLPIFKVNLIYQEFNGISQLFLPSHFLRSVYFLIKHSFSKQMLFALAYCLC